MKQLFDIIDIDAGKGRQAAHMTIQIGEQFFYIDKANTFDAGWETMVFPCDENGEVENWIEIYSDRSGKSLWECVQEFAESYFKDQLDTHINS